MIAHVSYLFFFPSLLLCCLMCLGRVGSGPTAADRMVAVDTLGTIVVGFAGILTILSGKEYLMNVAIVWALISFIGTLALSKYLEGREFDD